MAVTYLGGGAKPGFWNEEYEPSQVDPLNQSWTMPSGSDTILLMLRGSTSSQYNGATPDGSWTSQAGTVVWWLNPASGAHTIYSPGGSYGTTTVWQAFAGVDTSDPWRDQAAVKNSTSTTCTITVNCAAGDMAVGFGFAAWNLGGCQVYPGSGYTRPGCCLHGQDQYIAYRYNGMCEYKAVTSGSTIVIDISTNTGRDLWLQGGTLKPKPSPGGNRMLFAMSKIQDQLERNIAKRLKDSWQVNRDGLMVPQPGLMTI